MRTLFWLSLAGVIYAYFGYPFLLWLLGRAKGAGGIQRQQEYPSAAAPPVSILIPIHNEERILPAKMENTLALRYSGPIEIIAVSDGSTDRTVDILRSFEASGNLTVIDLPQRQGKANALNVGLQHATAEIVVFSDASILLDEDAVQAIVQPFADPRIGCVSGEDRIDGTGGEGLYGRYELFLRYQESQIDSIVGASGSFYAQRRHLIAPFRDGLAPDFLSVLNTVEQGSRAVSAPHAIGYMKELTSSADEFQRKVRTVVRGMTALFAKKHLLNPRQYPTFSFFLFSHKVMRWLAPFFLLGLLIAGASLADETLYLSALILQILFYGSAALALLAPDRLPVTLPSKVSTYFTIVNLSILIAWLRYLRGVRQETWAPSRRAS